MKPMNNRSTVLVDIDDTLSDTQVAMLRYVNSKSAQPYRFEELTRAHREEAVPEYERLVQEFLADPQLVGQCRPYRTALAAMQQLHDAGYAIHIVSSRREPLHAVTTAWLKEHGFADYVSAIHPRSARHTGKEFKRLVAERIKPAAAFDDTLEVAEILAGTGVLVYLIHQPWNAGESLPENIHRAETFAAAATDFLNRQRAAGTPTPPS